mmetsp:Transcript_47526/g.83075  ORF Transcript_47526/g.83075 Transcript_47526/m.83075 type:complete len:245 (+) Transcript_47526:1402-2136(+)
MRTSKRVSTPSRRKRLSWRRTMPTLCRTMRAKTSSTRRTCCSTTPSRRSRPSRARSPTRPRRRCPRSSCCAAAPRRPCASNWSLWVCPVRASSSLPVAASATDPSPARPLCPHPWTPTPELCLPPRCAVVAAPRVPPAPPASALALSPPPVVLARAPWPPTRPSRSSRTSVLWTACCSSQPSLASPTESTTPSWSSISTPERDPWAPVPLVAKRMVGVDEVYSALCKIFSAPFRISVFRGLVFY